MTGTCGLQTRSKCTCRAVPQHDCRTIPTFVAGISQTARHVCVTFVVHMWKRGSPKADHKRLAHSTVACAMRTNGGGWEVAHSARLQREVVHLCCCFLPNDQVILNNDGILLDTHTHRKGEKLWIDDRVMEMFLWPTNCFRG